MLALKFGPHSDFYASGGDFYNRQLNWCLKHAFEYRFIVASRKKLAMMEILASSLHVPVSAVASVSTRTKPMCRNRSSKTCLGTAQKEN